MGPKTGEKWEFMGFIRSLSTGVLIKHHAVCIDNQGAWLYTPVERDLMKSMNSQFDFRGLLVDHY